ncbi:hypothetical protein YC2023_057012 [Brassica napus]
MLYLTFKYLMILGYMLASTGSNHGIAALSSCTGRQGCLGNHEREYFKVVRKQLPNRKR